MEQQKSAAQQAREIREAILQFRHVAGQGTPIPERLRKPIMQYLDERLALGVPKKQIAREIGFSYETLRKWSYGAGGRQTEPKKIVSGTSNEVPEKRDQSNAPGQRVLMVRIPEDVYWRFKQSATKARMTHLEYFCALVRKAAK